MKDYDENSNNGYFLEVDVEYPKILFNLHIDLPFLAERNKIKKFNKLVCNIYDKENHVVHIRALKQALNHGLILKSTQSNSQSNFSTKLSNMNTKLETQSDMNAELKTEAKNDFEK